MISIFVYQFSFQVYLTFVFIFILLHEREKSTFQKLQTGLSYFICSDHRFFLFLSYNLLLFHLMPEIMKTSFKDMNFQYYLHYMYQRKSNMYIRISHLTKTKSNTLLSLVKDVQCLVPCFAKYNCSLAYLTKQNTNILQCFLALYDVHISQNLSCCDISYG